MASTENHPVVTGIDIIDPTVELIGKLKTTCEIEYFNDFDDDVDLKDFCEDHKHFLSLICEIGDERLAVTYGGGILKRLRNTPEFYECRQAFINQQASKDSEFADQTPIEIAIAKNWQQMTEVLIENSADITFTKNGKELPLESIYSKFHSVMINQLNRNIQLIKDDFDESNELLWKVKYRYRPIVGAPSELDTKKIKPTDLLVKILRLKTWKRNEVLTHPLTRLFLNEENSKIRCMIGFSIIFHVLWYFYSALVITSLTIGQGEDPSDILNHDTGNSSTGALVTAAYFFNNGTPFYTIYSFLFVIVLMKEVFEWRLAPDKTYYMRQLENLGQWLLLIIVFFIVGIRVFRAFGYVMGSKCVLKFICVVGILDAGLLVQGQMTKTERFGRYNIMILKAVGRFMKFTLAYSPLFITFGCVFNLLLHEFKNDFADYYGVFKVFTVFAGELDFKETFYAEGAPNSCTLPGLIVFIIFVIIVTVILQNILVALTIDDIKELEMLSLVSHIAAELELIHILEAFPSPLHSFWNWIETKRRGQKLHSQTAQIQNGKQQDKGIQLDDLKANRIKPETATSLTSNPWKEKSFQELPDKIKTCIKTHFQCESK